MDTLRKKKSWWIIHIDIQTVTVYILIMYCIIFPADSINIKEILLFISLLACMPSFIKRYREGKMVFLLFYGLIYPALFTLISIIIGNSSLYGALSYGYVWVFLLLIPAIYYHNINIKKPFLLATTIVALMTGFVVLIDALGIVSIYSNPIVVFFLSMNELQCGKGELATFGYSMFFKSSPLMIFSYGYALKNKKWIYAAIFLFAFCASGTRANLIVALITAAAILLLSSETPSKKMIVLFLLITMSIIILPSLLERIKILNELKYDRSESIKLAAISSIFKHLNAEPYRYVFGSGIGSLFYSTGRNAYVDVVEVSFFDYFRQVGVVGFALFLNFLGKPIKYLYREERWMLICYIGYLAIAFTNPLLVTSTSFIAYIMVLSRAFSDEPYPMV